LTNVQKYVIIKDCGYSIKNFTGPIRRIPLTKERKCGIIEVMKNTFTNNLSENLRLACLNLIDYTKSHLSQSPDSKNREHQKPLVGWIKEV